MIILFIKLWKPWAGGDGSVERVDTIAVHVDDLPVATPSRCVDYFLTQVRFGECRRWCGRHTGTGSWWRLGDWWWKVNRCGCSDTCGWFFSFVPNHAALAGAAIFRLERHHGALQWRCFYVKSRNDGDCCNRKTHSTHLITYRVCRLSCVQKLATGCDCVSRWSAVGGLIVFALSKTHAFISRVDAFVVLCNRVHGDGFREFCAEWRLCLHTQFSNCWS